MICCEVLTARDPRVWNDNDCFMQMVPCSGLPISYSETLFLIICCFGWVTALASHGALRLSPEWAASKLTWSLQDDLPEAPYTALSTNLNQTGLLYSPRVLVPCLVPAKWHGSAARCVGATLWAAFGSIFLVINTWHPVQGGRVNRQWAGDDLV